MNSKILNRRLILAMTFIFVCFFGQASYSAPATKGFLATNVVILVIDGPRQSEMWQDPSRIHIPHLAQELAPQGTLLLNFLNNGTTLTISGHAALCTGFYERLENMVGSEIPRYAGMFQHLLAERGLPSSKAWIIPSKEKLSILGKCTEGGWQKYSPSIWDGTKKRGKTFGYSDDTDTMLAVVEILARDSPVLTLINLKEPDDSGHKGIWKNYLKGIEESDRNAANLWRYLQRDPNYKDKTDLFITHDHGRHLEEIADGFVGHGDKCAGCQKIALLAIGPDFKSGVEISSAAELIDLPVTVSRILGFSLPKAKGRFLKELFADKSLN